MSSKFLYRSYPAAVTAAVTDARQATLVLGDSLALIRKIPSNSVDLVFSSPPYCMGKEYESTSDVSVFIKQHKTLLPELVRIVKPGGSLCWQIGNHTKNGIVTPLDSLVIAEMMQQSMMQLRNRIIWNVSHGLHCTNRFSGRHETILWYSKGASYKFNLDAVRVPQKYPGKTHAKGPNKGLLSGNPLGKNPGDVWQIPNIKANHVEKTDHPCQFPVALPQIFVRALTDRNDLVFDPFMGSASTGVAAIIENRRFFGCEIDPTYIEIAKDRVIKTLNGEERVRPWNRETELPNEGTKVARIPEGFLRPETIP